MISSRTLARAITLLGLAAAGGGTIAGYLSYKKWLKQRQAIEEARRRREAGETDYLALTQDLSDDENEEDESDDAAMQTIKKSWVLNPTEEELLPWERPLANLLKREGLAYGATAILSVPAAVIATLAAERLVANMLKSLKRKQLEQEGIEKKAFGVADIPIIGPHLVHAGDAFIGALLGLALLSGGTALALSYPYFEGKHNIDVDTALQRGKLLAAAGTAVPVMVSAEDIEEASRAKKHRRKIS